MGEMVTRIVLASLQVPDPERVRVLKEFSEKYGELSGLINGKGSRNLLEYIDRGKAFLDEYKDTYRTFGEHYIKSYKDLEESIRFHENNLASLAPYYATMNRIITVPSLESSYDFSQHTFEPFISRFNLCPFSIHIEKRGSEAEKGDPLLDNLIHLACFYNYVFNFHQFCNRSIELNNQNNGELMRLKAMGLDERTREYLSQYEKWNKFAVTSDQQLLGSIQRLPAELDKKMSKVVIDYLNDQNLSDLEKQYMEHLLSTNEQMKLNILPIAEVFLSGVQANLPDNLDAHGKQRVETILGLIESRLRMFLEIKKAVNIQLEKVVDWRNSILPHEARTNAAFQPGKYQELFTVPLHQFLGQYIENGLKSLEEKDIAALRVTFRYGPFNPEINTLLDGKRNLDDPFAYLKRLR